MKRSNRLSTVAIYTLAGSLLPIAAAPALAQCEEPKWIQMNVSGPAARTGHAMAWDNVNQRVILFGGGDNVNTRFNDTWAWDGTSWTRVNTGAATPIARSNHAMGTIAGLPALFGGTSNGSDRLDDFRVLSNNQWVGLLCKAPPPPAAPSTA